MKRALILTAGFGEGHNTAARNLKTALEQTGECQAEVADLFALTYGKLNEMARKAYLAIINHAPAVWEKIYQLFDSKKSVEMNLPALIQMKRKLQKMLHDHPPDVILSTYPIYSFLLEKIARDTGGRHFPL